MGFKMSIIMMMCITNFQLVEIPTQLFALNTKRHILSFSEQ